VGDLFRSLNWKPPIAGNELFRRDSLLLFIVARRIAIPPPPP
jgi:hypothetical protein